MRRTLCPLFSLCAIFFVLSLARPAAALELKAGQEVGLAIGSVLAAGSVVSITGNAVTLAKGQPNRSWILSAYFFGTLNLVTSPLLLAYGRDPDAGFGIGMGAMHAAVGIVNFALGIYGSVLWRRALRQKEQAQPQASQLSLVPLVGRDSVGAPFGGVGVRVARF